MLTKSITAINKLRRWLKTLWHLLASRRLPWIAKCGLQLKFPSWYSTHVLPQLIISRSTRAGINLSVGRCRHLSGRETGFLSQIFVMEKNKTALLMIKIGNNVCERIQLESLHQVVVLSVLLFIAKHLSDSLLRPLSCRVSSLLYRPKMFSCFHLCLSIQGNRVTLTVRRMPDR